MQVWKTGHMANDFEPSPRLRAAKEAHVAAKAALKAAKEELALAIAEEVRGGAMLSRATRYAGYANETGRRKVRALGVEGDPSRVPPPVPPSKRADIQILMPDGTTVIAELKQHPRPETPPAADS